MSIKKKNSIMKTTAIIGAITIVVTFAAMIASLRIAGLWEISEAPAKKAVPAQVSQAAN